MSEQELREIDVKVALAFGWEWHLRPLHPAGHDNTEWRLVLLSPKSQAYTEETGGWVRYNEPIKTEEFSYLNNRSAKGVQYRMTHPDDIKHFERFSDWDRSCYYYRPGFRERINPADFYAVPRFSTDPAAADLVRLEIVKRWECYEEGRFYHGSSKNGLTYKCRIVTMKDPDAYAIHADLFVARCLAFLAAVEVEKATEPAQESE